MSDHLPMWIELGIDDTDSYLDSLGWSDPRLTAMPGAATGRLGPSGSRGASLERLSARKDQADRTAAGHGNARR